jgi:serine protease Do
VAAQLGVRETTGAFVNEMERRSSAYQAGIQPGDIIAALNGKAFTDPNHFNQLISDTPIGSTATIDVLREGRRVTLKVPVVQREG